jgi:hypothetical protein
MEFNITNEIKKPILAFIMIILPLIIIGLGAIFEVVNPGYYVLLILWFGMGIIFFNAIN